VESWEQLLAEEIAATTLDPMDDPIDDFGIEYEAWEELDCGGAKDVERDLHRWELDPASAEDYLSLPRFRGRVSSWVSTINSIDAGLIVYAE